MSFQQPVDALYLAEVADWSPQLADHFQERDHALEDHLNHIADSIPHASVIKWGTPG